jgi:hypothetical protein
MLCPALLCFALLCCHALSITSRSIHKSSAITNQPLQEMLFVVAEVSAAESREYSEPVGQV